jgi:hypothetical protein
MSTGTHHAVPIYICARERVHEQIYPFTYTGEEDILRIGAINEIMFHLVEQTDNYYHLGPKRAPRKRHVF